MIRDGESSAKTSLDSAVSLLACCGCIAYLCWDYLLIYAPGTKLYPLGGAMPVSNSYLFSAFVMCCSLLYLSCQSGLAAKLLKSNLMCGSIIASMSVGTLVYIYGFYNHSLVLDMLAGILTGFAAAAVSVWCINILSRLSTSTLCVIVPLAASISGAFCLTIAYFDTAILIAFTALMPFPAVLSLRHCLKILCDDRDTLGKLTLPADRMVVVGALISFVVVIAFAMGFLDAYDANSWCTIAWYSCVALALFCASAALVFFLRLSKSLLLLSTMIPLLLIVISIVPYGAQSSGYLGAALTGIGSVSFEAMLLMTCASYVQQLGFRPIRMYCVARIILAVIYQLGWYLGQALADDAFNQMIVGTALVLFVLSIEAICAIVISMNIMESRRQRKSADQKTEGDGGASSSEDINELVRRRCLSIQKKFGISDRELDVLVLLARGYSSNYIQEKLCIAPGTVNSHTRNIYAKLGVHSKAQIIALVQQLDS